MCVNFAILAGMNSRVMSKIVEAICTCRPCDGMSIWKALITGIQGRVTANSHALSFSSHPALYSKNEFPARQPFRKTYSRLNTSVPTEVNNWPR